MLEILLLVQSKKGLKPGSLAEAGYLESYLDADTWFAFIWQDFISVASNVIWAVTCSICRNVSGHKAPFVKLHDGEECIVTPISQPGELH